LRKGRGNRDGDRPPRFNKYEEGGSYGKRGNRREGNRRRDGDRNYDREGGPKYRDGEGGERRDRRDGRTRRPRDGEFEPRRDRPRKEETVVHNPKAFFNSKKPKNEGTNDYSNPHEKPSKIIRRKVPGKSEPST